MKMRATECENTKCCVFLNKSPSETLQMLEEVAHMPCEWKTKLSLLKQKFHLDISKGKVILELFFDAQGLIHHEYFYRGAFCKERNVRKIPPSPQRSSEKET
jgi:hypothetical protein